MWEVCRLCELFVGYFGVLASGGGEADLWARPVGPSGVASPTHYEQKIFLFFLFLFADFFFFFLLFAVPPALRAARHAHQAYGPQEPFGPHGPPADRQAGRQAGMQPTHRPSALCTAFFLRKKIPPIGLKAEKNTPYAAFFSLFRTLFILFWTLFIHFNLFLSITHQSILIGLS